MAPLTTASTWNLLLLWFVKLYNPVSHLPPSLLNLLWCAASANYSRLNPGASRVLFSSSLYTSFKSWISLPSCSEIPPKQLNPNLNTKLFLCQSPSSWILDLIKWCCCCPPSPQVRNLKNIYATLFPSSFLYYLWFTLPQISVIHFSAQTLISYLEQTSNRVPQFPSYHLCKSTLHTAQNLTPIVRMLFSCLGCLTNSPWQNSSFLAYFKISKIPLLPKSSALYFLPLPASHFKLQ